MWPYLPLPLSYRIAYLHLTYSFLLPPDHLHLHHHDSKDYLQQDLHQDSESKLNSYHFITLKINTLERGRWLNPFLSAFFLPRLGQFYLNKGYYISEGCKHIYKSWTEGIHAVCKTTHAKTEGNICWYHNAKWLTEFELHHWVWRRWLWCVLYFTHLKVFHSFVQPCIMMMLSTNVKLSKAYSVKPCANAQNHPTLENTNEQWAQDQKAQKNLPKQVQCSRLTVLWSSLIITALLFPCKTIWACDTSSSGTTAAGTTGLDPTMTPPRPLDWARITRPRFREELPPLENERPVAARLPEAHFLKSN